MFFWRYLPFGLVSRQSSPVSIEPFSRILFLFTKSDLKSILFPVTLFAFLSTQSTNVDRLLAAVFWTWLHLLQFCISNQSMNPQEDVFNKPWRPIPSQLIDVPSARMLRWTLFPICLVLSVVNDVLWPGAALSLAFFIHNEVGLSSHWFLRNFCNSWGYAMFNVGAARIASSAPNYTVNQRIILSFVCNALIVFTTIHAQDFRDEEGDKLAGRRTLPIVFPEASRIAILIFMVGWSVALSVSCGFHLAFATPFTLLSIAIGLHFHWRRSAEDDRYSYVYYNLWLATAQVVHLPCIAQILSW